MVRKRLLLGLISLLAIFMMLAIPVYAVSVSNALYVADIVVTNTGTEASAVSTNCTINTQALIDGKFATSDLKNTAIQTAGGTDIAYMPGVNSTDPWILFVPSIGGSEQKSYLFYSGGPAMQTGFHYFPDTGGMTTSDNASLELGDNFTIEQKGYWDTSAGSNKTSVYKEDAFRTYVSGDCEVKSELVSSPWTSPTGFVDNGVWTDEPNAYDDNTTSHAHSDMGGTSWSAFLDLTLPTAIDCSALRFDAYYHASYISEIDLDAWYNEDWQDVYQGNYTNHVWVEKPLGDTYSVTKARAKFYNAWGSPIENMSILYEFDFKDERSPVTVTAANVSSGDYPISTSANTTHLWIDVNGTQRDITALSGASVFDNSNDWAFVTNGTMPYMEYQKIWVNGTLQQHIIYERSSTFSDQSDNNHDATPTFRTTSSDSDVSAALSNFRPINEAKLTGYSTEDVPEMLETPPTAPSEFYTEGETEHLPGASLVNTLLDAGGIPHALFWIPMCYGMAAVAAVLSFKFLKSMLLISIIAGVIILFFSLTGVIPLWTLIPFAIMAIGVVVGEKHLSW